MYLGNVIILCTDSDLWEPTEYGSLFHTLRDVDVAEELPIATIN